MISWYAVYVNVKHEKKVVKKLQEHNIEAYSPVTRKLQQWTDRKKWVEFPMLSGYVFVKINILEKERVLNCRGVIAFIKFNGIEAKVKENEIDILKSIELNGYDVTQEMKDFKILDEVLVTEGPLKGLTGTVLQFHTSNYVQIQLESLNQNIKVKLPSNILKVKSFVT